MESDTCRILTVNGGSSSIEFALFEAGAPPHRMLRGGIERIGRPDTTLAVTAVDQTEDVSRSLTAQDHAAAVEALMVWVEQRAGREPLTAVGHRLVHGGPNYSSPQRTTTELVEELRWLSPFDPSAVERAWPRCAAADRSIRA